MQLTDERKKRVIELYFNQRKTYAEIAEIEGMSPRDINVIMKEQVATRQKYQHQQKQEETSSKAYELFSEKKSPIEVAITLSLRGPEATKLFIEYCRLKRLHLLNSIFKETNRKLGPFLKLYKLLIKQRGMSIEQVVNVVEIAIHKLPYMESLNNQAKEQVDKMQRTIQRLSNDIGVLEGKISRINLLTGSIAFQIQKYSLSTLNCVSSTINRDFSSFKKYFSGLYFCIHLHMLPLLWKNVGANFISSLKIAVAQGCCLGGSTVINDAVCFRIPHLVIY
jgi:hypothetical protein